MSLLNDLIISRVRVKILGIFLNDPGQLIHVREIVRKSDEEINAVRRELAHLEKIGAVTSEKRANRLYYVFRKDYPLYYDLLNLISKTMGLGAEILKHKNKLGKVRYAMFSGRYVRNIPGSAEEVDLLIVGDVVIPEVVAMVHAEEQRRNREIFFTPMSEDEFVFRKKKKDPFLLQIINGSKVMIIGDEEEFVK